MADLRLAADVDGGAVVPFSSTLASTSSTNNNYYPITIEADGSFIIKNAGTAAAPCTLTIIPKADIVLFTVTGLSDEPLTFRGVKAGDRLVLDGVSKKVLLNDEDSIANFDGWEFPKLKPGNNKVQISNAISMYITVAYKPRFI